MAQMKRSKTAIGRESATGRFVSTKDAKATAGRTIVRQSAKSELTREEIRRAVAAVTDKAS